MELKFDFEGQVAVVTGAASGMGFSIAKAFAEAGASVAMVDVNETGLLEKQKEICGKTEIFACDITKYENDAVCIEEIYEKLGRIDILVNCAGGTARRMLNVPDGDLTDVPISVFDWGIDLNMKAPLYLSLLSLKKMKEHNSGVIINFGSVTGEEGDPWGIDYAVSKSAVMGGLTKSLALYGAPYNIRCCCVSPGPIMTRPGMAGMTTLLKRAGEPEDVMRMVLYLASDYGNFITGTNYFIDGGRVITPDKTWGGNNN